MKYLFTFFALLIFTNAFSQNKAEWLKKTGSSKLDTMVTLQAQDKSTVDIPITIISGAEKGPTFTITAGIHGMEYQSIMSLVKLSKEIDPAKLKGTVIIMPIINQPAFFKRVPFINPMDGININRAFPGRKNGTITEVIADFMTTQIFPATDVLLDMHAGDINEDLIPFICYYDNKKFAKQTGLAAKLSEISGFEKIVIYPYTLKDDQPAEYAFKQAVRQGITAISIETGKLGETNDADISFNNDAIYRMFKTLGTYDQVVKKLPESKKHYRKQTYISVPVKGLFYSQIKAGDLVKKGDKLGYINDVFGKELKEIIASESGIVLYKIGTPPVNPGETLFCIAEE